MKKQDVNNNQLCETCRKKCKQPNCVLVASCPSYQPLPKDLRSTWVQMELKFGKQKKS